MKLRIKGNSIRLRLTKTEVANFAKDGIISEQTQFATGTLTYVLFKDDKATELKASMQQTTITVHVPAHIAKHWTNTDDIGFQNNYQVNQSVSLFLLVEKDFVCLDNTIEDQSDNYPNPNAVC